MGWITSFIFLYASLYLFERKRVQLDWYQVLVVALFPALIYGVKLFVTMLMPLPPIVDAILWLSTYPIVFLLLWKMMGVARTRSIGYAAALFVFDLSGIWLLSLVVGSP
jgi:hypothetical protein